jgi:hypothetical protein
MAGKHHKYAPICQSCGMPIERSEWFGTYADGRKSVEYCQFCFQGGEWTEPDATMEDMVGKVALEIAKNQNLTDEKAERIARELMGTLKRWYGGGE